MTGTPPHGHSDDTRKVDPLALTATGGKGPSPDTTAELPHIEGYEIVDQLGSGGMGVVWRALQLSTRRHVALKLMGGGMFGSEVALRRFEREVELASRLEHPNVARVYDSGLYRGVCFYAMELIEGIPLDVYVDRHGVDERSKLELRNSGSPPNPTKRTGIFFNTRIVRMLLSQHTKIFATIKFFFNLQG